MANRHNLHISKTEEFKNWLIINGWEILPLSDNPFEVIRAKRHERCLVIYRKERAKEHLSYADRDADIVGQFLRERRRE